MIAPPIDSGSENRMVIGCRKLSNRTTSTAKTIIRPSRMAVGEAFEQLLLQLRIAGLGDRDARAEGSSSPEAR